MSNDNAQGDYEETDGKRPFNFGTTAPQITFSTV